METLITKYIEIHGCPLKCADSISNKQLDKLLSHKLISTKQNHHKSLFVGIIHFHNCIIISLPYGVKCNENELDSLSINNLAKNTIASIRKHAKHFSTDKEIVIEGWLASAYELIEDYELNGLLELYIKTNTLKSNGSINWNKTISKQSPLRIGDSWIYSNFYRRNREQEQEYELRTLQQHALHIASSVISLFDDRFKYIADEFQISLSPDSAKEKLDRVCALQNKDREKQICSMVRSILTNEENDTFHAIYSKSFHTIWEAALYKTLNSNDKLIKSIPQTTWLDTKNSSELGILKQNASSPSVDIIFEHENKLHILDAKYYDLINQGNRPGTTDLWKQFGYAELYRLSTASDKQLIKNGFIFPYYSNDKHFIKFTNVSFNIDDKSTESIPGYLAPIDLILEGYANGKTMQHLYIDHHANDKDKPE